jgi:hypothetical protein
VPADLLAELGYPAVASTPPPAPRFVSFTRTHSYPLVPTRTHSLPCDSRGTRLYIYRISIMPSNIDHAARANANVLMPADPAFAEGPGHAAAPPNGMPRGYRPLENPRCYPGEHMAHARPRARVPPAFPASQAFSAFQASPRLGNVQEQNAPAVRKPAAHPTIGLSRTLWGALCSQHAHARHAPRYRPPRPQLTSC